MSLRHRIAAGATLAVATVAIALGLANYLTARSHLIGELQSQLRARAGSATGQPQQGPFPSNPNVEGSAGGTPPTAPTAPPLGGAPGYFQFVTASGHVTLGQSGAARLPVDKRVRAVASGATPAFFASASLRGIHVEILTTHDQAGGYAIEVALPLTSVDAVSHQMLLSDGILAAIGILLAGGLGWLIARSALNPIDVFLRRTEGLELTEPDRLVERGPRELRRLAVSFNRTLEALRRSILSQRNLVADASHELRTPMAALRSNLQVLLLSEDLTDEGRQDLERAIFDELDDLGLLIGDVVELARDPRPQSPAMEVELDVVVQEAVERARRRAPHLRFTADLEPALILNTPDRVSRAVTNVIDNASKWSPEGGTVEIVLRERQLFVRDHGPGFDPSDLPYVFDRFYRSPAARRTPGSGLGLAIVKQAAEAFGGTVHADNASDGGAIIRLSFG
jgi:two-component system sensor histidine kinase MprB